jgi:hypothetical protein
MSGGRAAAISLALIAMVFGAALAHADRRATSMEREQIAGAKGVELPPQCAKVRVSTVTEKPKWASAQFKPGGSECESHASDGVTILKKRSGRWRFVTAGSDFTCAELYRDVPEKIAKDLRIPCRQA